MEEGEADGGWEGWKMTGDYVLAMELQRLEPEPGQEITREAGKEAAMRGGHGDG